MRINVRLFAILRDRAGTPALTLELPEGASVSAALGALANQYPALRDFLPRVACAVDQEYVSAETVLQAGQELALIPPVSGG